MAVPKPENDRKSQKVTYRYFIVCSLWKFAQAWKSQWSQADLFEKQTWPPAAVEQPTCIEMCEAQAKVPRSKCRVYFPRSSIAPERYEVKFCTVYFPRQVATPTKPPSLLYHAVDVLGGGNTIQHTSPLPADVASIVIHLRRGA